ncbi:MAG: FAD-binding oxidoreductase [Betaproteobacteria bacterium]
MNDRSPESVIDRIRSAIGAQAVLTAATDIEPYIVDWRGVYRGAAAAVVRPANTAEVAAVMRICAETGTPVVPQGGNTGMCGASVPGGPREVVLSLARMNKVLAVDPLNNTITVEAGCVLATIQQAAAEADRLFPLSLGAEGTLGIITAATLKLFPRPAANATAWMAVPDPEAALKLLALMRKHCNDRITAFELISRHSLELVWRHIPGTRDPIATPYSWYVLTELADSADEPKLRGDLERALEEAIAEGLVSDAVIADNRSQAQALWHMRESIPEGARQEPYMVYRHDIAVAVGRIPEFIREAQAALEARFAGVQLICFGHLGDGNLHYNAYIPERLRTDAAARDAHDVTETVYDIVQRYGGSFSAEHGIGLSKVAELARYKSAVELDLMRTVKRALDPQGLMNPGKLF